MKEVIIIGAGGHAAEIDEYIRYAQRKTGEKKLKVIGFIDDAPEAYGKYRFSAPDLGSIREHEVRTNCDYIIGIANIKYRQPIIERFVANGARFTSFIHCDAYISESAKIGKGVVIAPSVNVGPNVVIGDYTLLNARCSRGHDTIVGKYNFISPNVCFSGFTTVGDGNLFGINSATIPGINIGDGNKIAAGMTLDKNIGNDAVVFYRFKERVIAVPK